MQRIFASNSYNKRFHSRFNNVMVENRETAEERSTQTSFVSVWMAKLLSFPRLSKKSSKVSGAKVHKLDSVRKTFGRNNSDICYVQWNEVLDRSIKGAGGLTNT